MTFAGEGLFLAELCLLIYCVLNIVTTPAAEIRNLPKLVWLLLVVVFPLAGGIAWLIAGRPRAPAADLPSRGNRGVPAQDDRPRPVSAASPDDDEEFLHGLQARVDAQRDQAVRQQQQDSEREQAERSQAWQRRHGKDDPEA